MAYKVLIQTGKGKNLARSGSIPLKTKKDVSRWVKKSPLGKWNTKIEVINLRTKKVITGVKSKFMRSKWK